MPMKHVQNKESILFFIPLKGPSQQTGRELVPEFVLYRLLSSQCYHQSIKLLNLLFFKAVLS